VAEAEEAEQDEFTSEIISIYYENFIKIILSIHSVVSSIELSITKISLN
jgi:hypothetical protein